VAAAAPAADEPKPQPRADRVEPLLRQLEDDLLLTMQLIGYSADAVRSKVGESINIVDGIRGASSDLSRLSSTARDVTTGLAETTERLERSSQAIERDVSGTDDFIHEAHALADDVTRRMGQLGTAVERIATVVAVIGTIARQTNLLALNASIEAARAGVAGRGFAVVATEVKSLAHEVQNATGEVASQIAMLQNVARESGEAVGRIATLIRRVDPVLGSIRTTVGQQIEGIHDVAERASQSLAFAGAVSDKADAMTRLTDGALTASRTAGDAMGHMEVTLRRLTRRSMASLRNTGAGNRRSGERVPVSLAGHFDIDDRTLNVRSLDLSLGGAFIECRTSGLVAGMAGRLRLERIGTVEATLVALGSDDASGTAHVRFDSIDDEILDAISSIIDGVRHENEPLIRVVQAAAAEVSGLFEKGVASGSVNVEDLITIDYRRIEGTHPVQYETPAYGFYQHVLPPVLARYRATLPSSLYFIAGDRNVYTPIHNPEYSLPQRPDDYAWNDLHARHKRIMERSRSMVAARNEKPYLLNLMLRNMNDGRFVPTKLIAAPIFVRGRLWGNIQTAFPM
jgi:methyl-accepting chemotaxis protein